MFSGVRIFCSLMAVLKMYVSWAMTLVMRCFTVILWILTEPGALNGLVFRMIDAISYWEVKNLGGISGLQKLMYLFGCRFSFHQIC